ncbi:MAG: hypothetical protein ACFE0R_15640 [Salinarimonas sp.]
MLKFLTDYGIAVADLVAATSLFVSLLAIIGSIYPTQVSRRVATIDFQAAQKVKQDTAQIISALRALMIKAVLYTQAPTEIREKFDIDPEKKRIHDFLHSPTALAYYAFVSKKSERARKKGVPEEWRTFYLQLASILTAKNPYHAGFIAAQVEGYFDGLTRKNIKELAASLDDIPSALELLFQSREHDVVTHVFMNIANKEDDLEEVFPQFMKFLKNIKNVDDPDVDLWYAVTSDDDGVELAKSALDRGANRQVSRGTIVERYKSFFEEFSTGPSM